MNLLGKFNKAPAEITPYSILYADDLDAGELLGSTSAAVEGDGALTVVYAFFTNDPSLGPFVKTMLAGGTLGQKYTVTVASAVVGDGRVMVDTFVITIK